MAWGGGGMQRRTAGRAGLCRFAPCCQSVPVAGRTAGSCVCSVSASRRDWAGLWQALLSPRASPAALCRQSASAASAQTLRTPLPTLCCPEQLSRVSISTARRAAEKLVLTWGRARVGGAGWVRCGAGGSASRVWAAPLPFNSRSRSPAPLPRGARADPHVCTRDPNGCGSLKEALFIGNAGRYRTKPQEQVNARLTGFPDCTACVCRAII